jgi:hypothetical protein
LIEGRFGALRGNPEYQKVGETLEADEKSKNLNSIEEREVQ